MIILHGSSSCPAFSQFDWLIIGQDSAILSDGFRCWTKRKTHVDENCLKILGKLPKVIKLGKMSLIKLSSDYFSENSRWIFGKYGNQQKTLGKWFWSNFVKNVFSENCRLMVGECSEYFRFCHVINYLLTGLLVPYREILNPCFLRTDLASSAVLQNLGLSISRYGPHIRLMNSKCRSHSRLCPVPLRMTIITHQMIASTFRAFALDVCLSPIKKNARKNEQNFSDLFSCSTIFYFLSFTGSANFGNTLCWGEMNLIGQFFLVGSPGCVSGFQSGNQRLATCVRIQESSANLSRWWNAIWLVIVERGKLCHTISFVKLK